MEEDIIYNDVVKIERTDETEEQRIKRLQEELIQKKKQKENDILSGFDFGDDY